MGTSTVVQEAARARGIVPIDTVLGLRALETSLASGLATSLGAELAGGVRIETDPMGLTSVPGLYVAGDASEQVQSVAVATGSGARAAYAINAELAAR